MGKHHPPVTLTCGVCAKPFQRYASQLRHGETKSGNRFCGVVCLGQFKRNRKTYACPTCGTSFERRDGEAAGSRRQFCSRACYEASRPVKPETYKKVKGKHAHRAIVEAAIGRPLTSVERVHHIDRDRHNNSLSNLALCPDQATHMAVEYGRIPVDPYRVDRMVAA
jgi:protein-arginine kinase activator protein McsA